MHEFLERDLSYVIRLDEVLWGIVLLAVTLFIHGIGVFQTLRVSTAILGRTTQTRAGYVSMGILILAASMIVVTNLIEVALWAGFFVWRNAQPNVFSAFYNAMLNYTTLQAGYLPVRWRLLEGILGMAGLLTMAWSTSVLYTIAQQLMQDALKLQRERRQSRLASTKHDD